MLKFSKSSRIDPSERTLMKTCMGMVKSLKVSRTRMSLRTKMMENSGKIEKWNRRVKTMTEVWQLIYLFLIPFFPNTFLTNIKQNNFKSIADFNHYVIM